MAAKKKTKAAKGGGVPDKPVPKKTKQAAAPAEEQGKGHPAETRRSEKSKHDFPIVGIGASAGGLEAIEGLVSRIPSDSGVAYVIIQHLPPDHKSIMGSLLARRSEMEIRDIADGDKVRPDCIYLAPPEHDVDVMHGKFTLTKTPRISALKHPIDHFFRSLADDRAEASICIILSGTGSDGTIGMKAIKAAGGMAMVQKPEEAKYAGMPQSAIETGLVDFIMPVEKMAEELAKYVRHPYIRAAEKPLVPTERFEDYVRKIFVLVRRVTGHDFSHYKRSTVRRRIERRMAVHQLENIADYHRFLQENNHEAETLFKDLLITVTNFFRDPKAFDVLHEECLVPLLENKQDGQTSVRVWVPGCATGEEAYSIAMLLLEIMDRLDRSWPIQIFASDLDADAIEQARRGDYPEAIAADVNPQRLKRFFDKFDARYVVKKHVREMIIFAVQNLIKDPPFSKLDLLSCRNVLIYMDGDLQKQVLPLFHYTLNPGGILFLGTSESIGAHTDLFDTVDGKWKIFKRRQAPAQRQAIRTPPGELAGAREPLAERSEEARQETDIRRIAECVILTDYGWPAVFVDTDYHAVYFHGDTGDFLRQPGGEPSVDVLKMARPELKHKLGAALDRARKDKRTVVSEGFKLRTDGNVIAFDLVVRPIARGAQKDRLFMVIFRTQLGQPEPTGPEHSAGPEDARIVALESELQSTREYLRTTVEELETSNEELRSSNEELQSTNEELQSTNEELETSREELQATNEELETVNAELRNKVNQLAEANNDLSNLLASTNIATIFLDEDLNIKRFTPAIKDIFNLITADVGRPVSDIAHKLRYDRFSEDVHQVLKHLGTIQKEMQCQEGHWYLMRIQPYRTLENAIDGVVITFSDINAQKQAEFIANKAQAFAEGVIEAVGRPLLVLDTDLRIRSANKAFYKHYDLSPDEVRNRRIHELDGWPINPKPLVEHLERFVAQGTPVEDLQIPQRGDDSRLMQCTVRRIRIENEETGAILLMFEPEK